MVDELEIVAPNVNAIAADLDELQTQAESSLIPKFDFATYAKVFGDFESFFETYGETETDALATTLGIVTGAASGTFDVVAGLAVEVEKVPFEEFSGNLESLLPAIPVFPVVLGLDDFGIPDQADCIAQGVGLSLEDELYTITSTIYTRDLGPVMLFFLPLQYAVVDGEFVGTIPISDITVELSLNFGTVDSDANNVLSLAEVQAAIPGASEEAFADIDVDSNGSLTLHEIHYYDTGADTYEPDDMMTEASPIAAGETQSHSFHTYYDVDWLAIEVTEPATITLDAVSDSSDLYFFFDVYDAAENGLAFTEGYAAALTYTFDTPGTYYFAVYNDGIDESTENWYTLSLAELVP